MEENVIVEIESLLDEAQELMAEGAIAEASDKIEKAKKKIRPIGTGTNGPEPKVP